MPFSSIADRVRCKALREAGFTLIEVMVASVILGMTVSAIVFMVLNSSALRLSNDHNRQARAIAQEELEDPARHFFRYGNLDGNNSDINLDHAEGSSQVATVAHRDFTITVVDTVVDGVAIQFNRHKSTVTWSENGRNTGVTLYKRTVRTK